MLIHAIGYIVDHSGIFHHSGPQMWIQITLGSEPTFVGVYSVVVPAQKSLIPSSPF